MPFLNMKVASAGTINKATTIAEMMAKIILIAIGWNNFASTPSKLNKGKNTTKMTEAAKNTGRATSLPACFSRNSIP